MKCVHGLFAVWFLLLSSLALAQAPAATKSADGEAAHLEALPEFQTSPVVIDGQILFHARGVTSLPSEKRAANIVKRIEAAASDPRFDPAQVRVVDEGSRTWIYAGNVKLMGLVDADARLEGVERAVLAQLFRDRIERAIRDYRAARTSDYLLKSAAYAAIASLLLVVFIFVARWTLRRVTAAVEHRTERRMAAVEAKSRQLIRVQQLRQVLITVSRLFGFVLGAGAIYFYLSYVLSLFPWTFGLSKQLFALVVGPLQTMGKGILAALPGLIFILVLIFVVRYVLGLIRMFFTAVGEHKIHVEGFDPDWAWPTYRLVRTLVTVLALVVAYPYIPGSESGAFKGISLFLGVLFSLGSTSLIANILAGYTLTYRRAFRVGDRIQVGEHVGDVTATRMMVTHLRTPKNEEVVVPNSLILSSNVINFSTLAKQNGLILHTTVGIGYETPWRQVEAMLKLAADRTAGVLKQPEPFVLQTSLGDFCVVYEINAYTDRPHEMPQIYSELHRHIQDAFNEYGVQIMTPNYVADPDSPKVVLKKDWFASPASPGSSPAP